MAALLAFVLLFGVSTTLYTSVSAKEAEGHLKGYQARDTPLYVVGPFVDSGCTMIGSFAPTVLPGNCSADPFTGLFFNITPAGGSNINYQFGCPTTGCGNCIGSGTARVDTCITVPGMKGGYKVWPLITNVFYNWDLFIDSACTQPTTPQDSGISGHCDNNPRGNNVLLSAITADRNVWVYGIGCSFNCLKCRSFGFLSPNQCVFTGQEFFKLWF